MIRSRTIGVLLSASAVAVVGTSIVSDPASSSEPVSTFAIHVNQNHLIDAAGQTLRVFGVDRPGTEYMCIQDDGIFDGPTDTSALQAIKSWKTNAVRVPLNEDCW